MPLINYLKIYRAKVATCLEPDERLLVMGPYMEPLIGDESKLDRTMDGLSPRMRRLAEKTGRVPEASDRFILGFDLLAGGLQVNPNRINRWMGGLDGVGVADSIAGRIWRLANQHDKDSPEWYVVTDRRLLLLNNSDGDEFRIVFVAQRDQIVVAVRKGKLLLQRGRVEVGFTDGSMKAWTAGMLSAARARSLVAALNGTEPRAAS